MTDGIASALAAAMAKCVEELSVYQKANAASAEVSALILRPEFDRDFRLRGQLGASSERVASLISEGFEQSTDRHFAQYCYRSKGSCAEMRTQLAVARDRKYIRESERVHLDVQYEEIAKMLSGSSIILNGRIESIVAGPRDKQLVTDDLRLVTRDS